MDAEDRELFERSLAHAASSASGAALDAALAELGWYDGLTSARADAVALAFEQQGFAGSTSSALGAVVLQALGLDPLAGPVVLPVAGSADAPGRVDGGSLVVDGVVLGAIEATLVVPTADGTATVAASDLDIRPARGIDPDLGVIAVTGTAAGDADASGPWGDAVDVARLAIGHELVGHSRRMLDLAREHALDRVQFGRPIGTFQAVRHRLAEALVAIETADAALGAAWLDPTAERASAAKALAGHGARTASRHCQQVLAGIGFTTEHELHEHIRRVVVLDQLFGAAVTLTRSLGEQILSTGRLPDLLPL